MVHDISRNHRWMQRSAFLVSVLKEREDKRAVVEKGNQEEFALDCHNLSLENVFVDEKDHTKIVSGVLCLSFPHQSCQYNQTCVIDWESTTTRPLWAAAHLPAFIQSSPFVAKLFRNVVVNPASDPTLERSVSHLLINLTSHCPLRRMVVL
jgi:hypothetical protein